MVELGRQQDPVIDQLEKGDYYQRGLALNSCYGSRDAKRIARFLENDPSARLRGLARHLTAHFSPDEDVLKMLSEVGPAHLQGTLAILYRRRRKTALETWQKTQPPPVTESSHDWRRLARYRPVEAARRLQEWAERVESQDNRLTWATIAAFPELSRETPDAALRLVTTLALHRTLERFPLTELTLRRPQQVAALILERDERPDANFTTRVAHLTREQREKLLQRNYLPAPERWLKRLPAAEREHLFRLFGTGWRDGAGALPVGVLRVLPSPTRQHEARRCLDLPDLQTRPLTKLPYATFLDWDDSRAELKKWLGDPDPDLRRAAIGAQLRATRYNREKLGEALALVRHRKNEQDPIRAAMLEALSDLPPGRWTPAHLPEIDGIMQEAHNANDLSHGTRQLAAGLVMRLLPFHPEWASGWLPKLAQEGGNLFMGGSWQLRWRDLPRLAASLFPVFKGWANRERESYLLAAAGMLGKRLKQWPDFLDLLESLASTSRTAWTVTGALQLLQKYAPERLDRLIPSLLKTDESYIIVSPIAHYLHTRRQDLLTPFLGHRIVHGRYSTGKTYWILPFTDGFHRWTSHQQTLFYQTVRHLAKDAQRETPTLRAALEQLTGLPDGAETLKEIARVDFPRPAIRDLAVRALARRDNGDGLKTLLDALTDERARIAIYALRQALKEAKPRDAAQLLRDVPTTKVTVAKEVVRLLGELPPAVAYIELQRLATLDLHRDVRVALLRALWDHLEEPATWPLLNAAAADEDPAVAAGVVRIPAERLTPTSETHLVQLIKRLLHHPAPRVRLQTQQRLATLPVNDPEAVLQDPLRELLESPAEDERLACAQALFAVYGRQNLTPLAQTLKTLLPRRQALSDLLGQLHQGARSLSVTRSVLEELRADPLTGPLQIRLGVRAIPMPELPDWLETLPLHAETVQAGVDALHSAHREGMDELTRDLQSRSRPELRRLGLAALKSAATQGWTEERRARLDTFRADSDPSVAGAAQFTFPR